MRSIVPLIGVALAAPASAAAAEVVPVPRFQSIQLYGGGEVQLRRGAVQRVTLLEGSRAFTNIRVLSEGKLRIDACNPRCPRHYRLRILVESPTVPVLAVSGGGLIRAGTGFASPRALTVAVSGGGLIDTVAVPADVATAAVNGGGEIKVSARRVLTAAVNGGGVVRYWGNPVVTQVVKGGGIVRRY